MNQTPLDREIIVLQAVLESILSMVNHEILNFSNNPDGTQATFKSPTCRAFFNVLLADLLEPVDPDLIGSSGSLLDSLQTITAEPQLCGNEFVTEFREAVLTLRQWLDAEIEVQVWFATLGIDATLRLRRREFISICGNISKHNVSRLTRKAKALRMLMKRNGFEVVFLEALRALDDFQVRFQEDIFSYHSTTMAELFNNVRWGMHHYLEVEFKRAYIPPVSEDDPRYSFNVPEGLSNDFAKDRYWDLMNSVRAKPWIEKFTTLRALKESY